MFPPGDRELELAIGERPWNQGQRVGFPSFVNACPQSPAHWSGSSAHLSPSAPATHDEPKQSSVTTTVTPKREPHDDDAANEKTVGKRNAAPAPLITPANPTKSFTLHKGGKLRQAHR